MLSLQSIVSPVKYLSFDWLRSDAAMVVTIDSKVTIDINFYATGPQDFWEAVYSCVSVEIGNFPISLHGYFKKWCICIKSEDLYIVMKFRDRTLINLLSFLQDITMFPKPSVLIEIFLVILLKLNKKRRIYGR